MTSKLSNRRISEMTQPYDIMMREPFAAGPVHGTLIKRRNGRWEAWAWSLKADGSRACTFVKGAPGKSKAECKRIVIAKICARIERIAAQLEALQAVVDASDEWRRDGCKLTARDLNLGECEAARLRSDRVMLAEYEMGDE